MTIENAEYISQLNQNWPANTDSVAEGAGHDRVTKKALVQSFPNIDGPVTATPADLNQFVNKGKSVIVGEVRMYCGISAPEGWLLCDGSAIPTEFIELIALIGPNTPDLQGKFLRGASPTRLPLTTEAENVGAHSHDAGSGLWTGRQVAVEGGNSVFSDQGNRPISNMPRTGSTTGENRPANTAITYIVKT